jgi:translation initiation factor IF-2
MGQGGMRPNAQSVPGQSPHDYQGTQGGYHTGARQEGAVRPSVEEAGRGTSAQLSGKNENQNRTESGQKPAGQGGVRQGADTVQRTELGQRPVGGQGGQGYQGGQRQEGQQNQMQQRTSGQSSQGYQGSQRPESGQRSGNTFKSESGQRPAGQGGMRQGSYNQGSQGAPRNNNDQYQRSYGSDSGQRTGQGNRQQTSGQGYQRPEGGQGRNSGEGYQRQQGGYRQANSNGSGQTRQGTYERRTDRPQGNGYNQGGTRPGGGYNQGTRPSGTGYSQGGSRPSGQGGYSRTGSGPKPGGGYVSRGTDEFKKDEDDKPSYNRSGQAKRPGGQRSSERKNFDQQILDQKVAEKNDFSNKRNRDRINKEKTYKEKSLIDRDELESDGNNIKKIVPKKGQFIQPKPIVETKEDEIKTITIPEVLTIKELADKMKMPSSALVKKLFLTGKMVSINQEITFEEAEEIALEYEIIAEKEVKVNEIEELLKESEEDPDTLEKRPPVVCVMGHVDHGKTSLLDAIRETNVTSREAGGITQHIGAYVVEINGEKITFLDTPGHEAFTSMRLRGAKSTDIAILVTFTESILVFSLSKKSF